MEAYNFYTNFESSNFLIQILQLKESYFIYVGTSQMNFDNLSISMPIKVNYNFN